MHEEFAEHTDEVIVTTTIASAIANHVKFMQSLNSQRFDCSPSHVSISRVASWKTH